MCGICGWLDTKKRIDFQILENMNNIARYRGPDDEGYLAIGKNKEKLRGDDSCMELRHLEHIRNYNTPSYLALGHRRLSILDLSYVGHQPMSDDRMDIVFNGEIYNYKEIKKKLISLGYQFHTSTDTEVILKSYEEWGEECVSHFDGMWSFALWDGEKNELFCSRDRLGAKPFYYYYDDDRFIFSSEIKQICINPKIRKSINYRNITNAIVYGISDYSEGTFINEIKELRGGYNLIVRLNHEHDHIIDFHTVKYWDLKFSSTECSIDEVMDILHDSIRLRMRSDVPVGIMLSGGLDSSCLVAGVSDVIGDMTGISTFSSCYENFRGGDEKKYAELVNNYYHTNAHYVYPDAEDTLSLYKDMVWHVEGNYGFSAIGSFLTIQEASKTGIKVILNGQGSDESMLGYERYYSLYLKKVLSQKGLGVFFKEYRSIVENSKLNSKQLIEFLIYFTNVKIRRKYSFNRIERYITDKVKKICKDDHSIDDLIEYKNLDQMQYNEIRGIQLTHILRMDDRAYMAASVESRVPYIDYRYMEAVMSMGLSEKIHDGYTKYALRKGFEGKLPDEVIWRKNKMGWPSPVKRWTDRFDKRRVTSLFEHPVSGDIFNVDKIRVDYEKESSSYSFEKFLTTEILLRKFVYNEE